MPKKLDITGQKFFKLTGIREVGKNKSGATLWEFRCDCGEVVISSVTSVKRGNRKSCGCARKEALINRNKERLNDLTGSVFGKLTVVKRVGTTKSGNAIWDCSCSCGGRKEVSSGSLVGGSTKSCGCRRDEIAKDMVIDITNKTFSRLTALRHVGFDEGRNATWEFQCSCGNKIITVGKYVRDGHKKSCGCIEKEAEEERINSMIGRRFGRLVVEELAGKDDHGHKFRCKCSCGGETITWGIHLKNGHCTSCGCYNREQIVKSSTIHGMIDTPEYQSWRNMIQRCNNPKRKDYHNYGGRGIKVCEEWDDFEKFYTDIGNRPHPNLTLERRDNDGPYSKENCVWKSRKTQANNRRDNRNITYKGETKTLTQWARELNMSISALRTRFKNGWDVEKAFTEPVKKYKEKT